MRSHRPDDNRPQRELAGHAKIAVNGADRVRLVVVVPLVQLDRERHVRHLDDGRRAAEATLARRELRALRSEALAILGTLDDAQLKFGIQHRPVPVLSIGLEPAELDIEARAAPPDTRRVVAGYLDAHLRRHLLDIFLEGLRPKGNANRTDDHADEEPAKTRSA